MQDEQEKRFVLGELPGDRDSREFTAAPEPRVDDPEPQPRPAKQPGAAAQPRKSLWWLLITLMLAVTAAAIYILLATESAAAPVQTGGAAAMQAPAWLIALIAAFILCQITALLNAYNCASRRLRGAGLVKRVEFWCEVPIYLGFLGSLLAVCMTQYTTGSLTAPLAYLTSSAGIVLYLIGRLGIGLPAAEKE